MAFEDVKVEIAQLLARLPDQPRDRYELHMLLREKLGELRAFDLPLLDDLVALEKTRDSQPVREARDSTGGFRQARR